MDITVHVHHYFHHEPSDRVTEKKLDQLIHAVADLATQERHMATDISSIKQLVTDINNETNDVAAKVDAQQASIDDLKAQLAAGTPVTQKDLDDLSASLTPISDRLKAIGSNPAQPIPPVEPPPTL